jgi:membrane protein required for colicin V production
MDFMGFHIVDIILVSLMLFLAIKGLVNGFSKELLSFLTVVGGVALAARYNSAAVEFINAQKIAPTINDAYAKIIGFVIIIIAVWLIIGVFSSIINKITSNTTGFISRVFGYILSFGRYLFIFSLIVFGVSQSDFFKDEAIKLQKETKLFVPMTNIGAKLLNIDLNVSTPSETTDVNSNAETNLTSESTESPITTETKEETKEKVEVKATEENLSIDSSTILVDHNNTI